MTRFALIFALLPGLAAADGLNPPEEELVVLPPVVETAPRAVFTIRGGLSARPEYFGAEDYAIGPDLGFRLHYGRIAGREVGSVTGDRALGFSVAPSFRYVAGRSADDYSELAGLDDIDPAVELGIGARYAFPNVEVFADVRQGFGGHDGLVGEVGADLVMEPSDRLTLRLGPRVAVGDDSFNDTYFGVTAAESAASTFAAYDPEGGVVSTGVELGVTYDLGRDWGLEGAVRYDRLSGDAADSPLVQDDDQLSIRLGVTRRVTLDF